MEINCEFVINLINRNYLGGGDLSHIHTFYTFTLYFFLNRGKYKILEADIY